MHCHDLVTHTSYTHSTPSGTPPMGHWLLPTCLPVFPVPAYTFAFTRGPCVCTVVCSIQGSITKPWRDLAIAHPEDFAQESKGMRYEWEEVDSYHTHISLWALRVVVSEAWGWRRHNVPWVAQATPWVLRVSRLCFCLPFHCWSGPGRHL